MKTDAVVPGRLHLPALFVFLFLCFAAPAAAQRPEPLPVWLHVHAGRAIQHSKVVTYEPVVPACAATDAVNFYELRERWAS